MTEENKSESGIYQSIKITAKKDVIVANMYELQKLALAKEIEIRYAHLQNYQEGTSTYRGILHVPNKLILPLKDVVFEEFKEVDTGMYLFTTVKTTFEGPNIGLKKLIEQTCGGCNIGIEKKNLDWVCEFEDDGFESEEWEYPTSFALTGSIQGNIENVLHAIAVIKGNPYRIDVGEEELITSKAA